MEDLFYWRGDSKDYIWFFKRPKCREKNTARTYNMLNDVYSRKVVFFSPKEHIHVIRTFTNQKWDIKTTAETAFSGFYFYSHFFLPIHRFYSKSKRFHSFTLFISNFFFRLFKLTVCLYIHKSIFTWVVHEMRHSLQSNKCRELQQVNDVRLCTDPRLKCFTPY